MSFKEQLQKDLDQVFFNPKEFGEVHTLGGQSIICIVDNDRLFNSKNEGTLASRVLLYIPMHEVKVQLIVGDTITYDGEVMTVSDVYENLGMYQVLLEREVGQYRHDINIQRLQNNTDADGFTQQTWVHYHRCNAYMRNLNGDEKRTSNADMGIVTTLFKIPYVKGVNRNMRIDYNGVFYNIKYVDDVEGKHEYLEIRCEVIL